MESLGGITVFLYRKPFWVMKKGYKWWKSPVRTCFGIEIMMLVAFFLQSGILILILVGQSIYKFVNFSRFHLCGRQFRLRFHCRLRVIATSSSTPCRCLWFPVFFISCACYRKPFGRRLAKIICEWSVSGCLWFHWSLYIQWDNIGQRYYILRIHCLYGWNK